MKWYSIIKETINDIVGTMIVIWGMYDVMLNPRWEYVLIVLIGATLVAGKKLIERLPLPGLGGGSNDTPDT